MNDLSAAKKSELNVVYPNFQIDFEISDTSPNVAQTSVFFRANKKQIQDTQSFLKENLFYKGEISGKFNRETRNSLKKFQKAEKLKITGTINTETFEKVKCFVVNEIQPDLFSEIETDMFDTSAVNLQVDLPEENTFRPQFVNPNYRFVTAKKSSTTLLFDGKSDYLAIAAILLLFSLVVIAAFTFS
jgi:peptidoglycan hydrolase-like protein with peptidoglycan-binding domain